MPRCSNHFIKVCIKQKQVRDITDKYEDHKFTTSDFIEDLYKPVKHDEPYGVKENIIEVEEEIQLKEQMAPWRARWTRRLLDPRYLSILYASNLFFTCFLYIGHLHPEWLLAHYSSILVICLILQAIYLTDNLVKIMVLGLV